MAISKLAWTGAAKEVTPGTAVTPPTRYIPTKTTFKGAKKREYLNEERGDRNANYGVVDSVRQSTIEMKGPFYADTHPIVFWAAIGLPTTSQPNAANAPTVYMHTFPSPLVNIPPSYTIARNLDARAYYIPYSVLEKWSLHYTVDGKLLELDANFLGMYAQIYASPPTPNYSTVLPMAGYAPVIKFVDGVASNDVSDLQIDYSQKVTLWYGGNQSQDFVTVYFGERSITVDITARFDNDTLYNRWRNNTLDSLSFDAQGPLLAKIYTITLGTQTSGSFSITYGGQTASGIAYNATGATVQTALQGLSSFTPGANVTVTGSAGGPYTIVITGTNLNDGNAITANFSTLGTPANASQTNNSLALELNIQLPQLSWDTMEHDTSKDNVLIKAKGTAIVPAGASLITGFVQNTVSSFTT